MAEACPIIFQVIGAGVNRLDLMQVSGWKSPPGESPILGVEGELW